MNKRDAEKLKQKVIDGLLSNGFTATPDNRYEYHGEGSKGPIDVSVKADKRYSRQGWSVCVFGMFAEADRALAAGIDCNPYVGKHNFIFIESSQVDYIISQYI